MLSPEPTPVGGIPISAIALPALVHHIADRARQRPLFGIVATVNLDFLRLARRYPEFHELLAHRTELNVADGWPVRWLARTRHGRSYRTTGSDLVPALLRDPATAQAGVFLMGDTEDTLDAVRSRGRREGWYSAVAGMCSPSAVTLTDTDASRHLADTINCSGAATLLVALGAPRQELWMDRWRTELRPATGIGVGGAFRFLADPSRRAPEWMQTMGLEWAHRMMREPRRLAGRYVADSLELVRLVWDRSRS